MQPKVFISYSWSSVAHQELVQSWAVQLVADGVDVVLDIFDLKEGHDKFAFNGDLPPLFVPLTKLVQLADSE